MTDMSPARPSTTTGLGGALMVTAGLLPLLALLGAEGGDVSMPLAAVALAVGAVVLVSRAGGIAGDSRTGRIALILFGAGPLVSRSFAVRPPWAVLIGMSLILLITVATVLAAAAVIRARVLHGIARWALAVVAVDALATALMSSVQLGSFPDVYVGLQLELLRPLLLVVWGVALVLHGRGRAIRRRIAELDDAWRRSTDIGGAASEVAPDRTAQR